MTSLNLYPNILLLIIQYSVKFTKIYFLLLLKAYSIKSTLILLLVVLGYESINKAALPFLSSKLLHSSFKQKSNAKPNNLDSESPISIALNP